VYGLKGIISDCHLLTNVYLAHWRFLYFHGQKHARLIRHETVYNESKRERTLLITLLSPLLFFAPEVHLRDVECLWTDDVIIETVWKAFMTKLLKEWEGIILWVMEIQVSDFHILT
jgi:transposase